MSQLCMTMAIGQKFNVEEAKKIAVFGHVLYIVNPNCGVICYDIKDIQNIQLIGTFRVSGVTDIAVENNLLYVNYLGGVCTIYTDEMRGGEPLKENRLKANCVDGIVKNVRDGDIFPIKFFPKEDMPCKDETLSFGAFSQAGSLSAFASLEDVVYIGSINGLYTIKADVDGIIDLEDYEKIPMQTDSIETLFVGQNQEYLYLGGQNGTYIYSIKGQYRYAPEFVKEIPHQIGCDPIYVKNGIAFITVRKGADCIQNNWNWKVMESRLIILDLSWPSQPEALYNSGEFVSAPRGLSGTDKNILWVCEDGTRSGIIVNLIDVSSKRTPKRHGRILAHQDYEMKIAYDVILREDKDLAMVRFDNGIGVYQGINKTSPSLINFIPLPDNYSPEPPITELSPALKEKSNQKVSGRK